MIKQIGKYSVNIDVDNSVDIESEIVTMLAEEFQKETDKEITDKIIRQMLQKQGWHRVMVKDYASITELWCEKYLKGSYQCFGHYWYFKNLNDANFFMLKWGTT